MLSGARSGSRSRALLQPGLVRPVELAGCSRRWRRSWAAISKKKPYGSVFSTICPCRFAHLELVMRALAHAGNENLPDARRAQRAHRMASPVPAVEIADHADALRVGRPDGEAGARHAVDRAQLRAELVVNPPLVALAEQVQVRLAQRRQERIRVARASDVFALIRDDQIVGIDPLRRPCPPSNSPDS